MTNQQELDCIKDEMEYREWLESPLWYCVKTSFNLTTGKVESDFVRDNKTKLPITIQTIQKPQNGVFENVSETTYYTYHRDYEEAVKKIAAANV